MPAALPMARSAAAAISSITATSVTFSSRPWASFVPRRSRIASRPETPMATSTRPRRQARPKVSVITTGTSTPVQVAQGHPQAVGGAVGVGGEQHRGAGGGVGAVHPGVGADEAVAGAGDDQVAAAAQDLHRLLLGEAPVGGLLVALQAGDGALGLGDHLVGDHQDVPRLGAQAGPGQGVGEQGGQVVAGADLGQAGHGVDGEGHGRSSSQRAKRAAAAGCGDPGVGGVEAHRGPPPRVATSAASPSIDHQVGEQAVVGGEHPGVPRGQAEGGHDPVGGALRAPCRRRGG